MLARLFTAILAFAVTGLAGARDGVALPDIGSSAGTLLSPEDAERIGRGLMRELRGQELVLDDPLLTEYLETLGWRLVAHSDRPEQSFTFFLVRSPEINAFAAPGGYIGVHTGLVTTAESVDELAAVLAHETAHVTQNHLVRAFENVRNATLPIALAILGALIAAQGSGSGDAAQAAVVGGTALLQQQAINFTRHNEYEADRVGIGLMARAGFEPEAMATFFGRMGRALRANGEGPPEFLRTHPVTTTRITEAKNRAGEARRDRASPDAALTGERFALFRERARVLGAPDRTELLAQYERRLAHVERPSAAERYGLALAQLKVGRSAAARAGLEALVKERPEELAFALALAEAEHRTGRRAAALERLEALHALRPGHRAVALALAEQLVESGERGAARRAVEVLRGPLTQNGDEPLLQQAFARANELAGDEVRAGEAFAEVALLSGRFDDALGQLKRLLERDDVDYYARARIEARIAQITPIALEERRRPLREEDDRQRGLAIGGRHLH